MPYLSESVFVDRDFDCNGGNVFAQKCIRKCLDPQ